MMDVVFLIIVAAGFFFIGYNVSNMGRGKPLTPNDINDYIGKKFPDLWGAYKQGVHEGYEQGLRDGQNFDRL
jgi:hypothetical protein